MKDPHLQEWLLAPDGIATQLRLLRGERTGKDFAADAGIRPAKLSKLELAQQAPTEEDIRQIVAAAHGDLTTADDLVARLRQMPNVRTEGERKLRFGQVAAQRRLNERLSTAGHVRIVESLYIPRPLQEPAYAQALLEQLGTTQPAELEQAVAALTASAPLVFAPGRKAEIVLAESVLRWQVIEPAAMRAQLERILAAASSHVLVIRILPLDKPLKLHPVGSFTLYDDKGFLDSVQEGAELTGASLGRHVALMDRLWKASAAPSQTKSFVRAAIDRLP